MACALLLCGCTPSFQQKLKQEQADQTAYGVESHERASADQCNRVAVPGTTEHMACRLGIATSPPPKQP